MASRLPRVSVMVVTYNQVRLLPETLESILAQNYENLEIVISDDASSDGTQAVAQDYATRYPGKFVLVLNRDHLGITGNCNSGFFACTGELISTFSGDDLFLPGKVRAQADVFINDPSVALAYHSVDIFDSVTNKTLYTTFASESGRIENAADIITRGGLAGGCSVMVRRAMCPPHGFDPRLPTVSDWLFQIEVALRGKVAWVDGVYARYRKHKHGTTHHVADYLEETLQTLDIVRDRYADRPEVLDVCNTGKARYLAGEAFRQLSSNVCFARDLSRRSVTLDPANLRYRLLWWFTQFQFAAGLLGPILNQGKYFIRRYV